MRAKMMIGILALSMSSNGIYTKEPKKTKRTIVQQLRQPTQQRMTNYLPQKTYVNSSLLTIIMGQDVRIIHPQARFSSCGNFQRITHKTM
ncbi:exported hypothetical protein [Vibrio nigripulchritudo MADA3029]|nr:exported hypothetical protein [Vibrio nigripulchritudo MADA3020]CCN53064.1 exported hypothetical protein [Vibrio nigripulchritudo MADA3021]CCN60656.1 exported hypothetical protein [Vibrio nigripulchritudo MADA3029]